MSYQTFAHQINRTKTLLDGLQSRGEEMLKWGIGQEFVEELTGLFNLANQQEKERNELKAQSRRATTAQAETVAKMNHKRSIAKKLIKIALPPEEWPAFGFRAGEYAAKGPKETTEPEKPEKPVA